MKVFDPLVIDTLVQWGFTTNAYIAQSMGRGMKRPVGMSAKGQRVAFRNAAAMAAQYRKDAGL
mgnify:FL=1